VVPRSYAGGVAEDLSRLGEEEIEARLSALRERMQPLQSQLEELRGERDVLLTERRRRDRMAHVRTRAGLKQGMREGVFPTVAELVEGGAVGALDDFVYNLKTGGEVRLGFPGARVQAVHFTDGKAVMQAKDLAEAARLYAAGWELGSPGRPGVRVHFPGSRQERLVDPSEVFARPRSS
jgi:hypothetical protein